MKITIAPLSTPNSISLSAKEAILGAEKLLLQTAEHPSARWIAEAGLPFEAMDALYASSEDFDELNRRIANSVISAGDGAVFASPGRGPGAALRASLAAAAGKAGAELEYLPGAGYAEAAMCAAGGYMGGARVMEATALPARLDPYVPLCVEEIDTRVRAGEVKLALSEYYPDEFGIFFCHMDESGRYSAKSIPLYMLDRQEAYFAADVAIIPAADFEGLARHGIEGLMSVMERLRAPGGCPWDAEQTHESLKKSLIEESYEVLDAIDKNDMDALCEELGDVLLQVVFHARLEAETRTFTMRDVCTGIVNKLVYRHPHVFSNVKVADSGEVLANWEVLKQKEKKQNTVSEAMESIPRGFPALMRAQKLQKKAANIGFDWESVSGALEKLAEEAGELSEAIDGAEGEARVFEEAGDLLFSAVNAARLSGCDAELALSAASEKFYSRFCEMERGALEEGLDIRSMGLDELNARWERAKSRKY